MIPSGKFLAVDTETTGLSVWRGARPFCVTFCNALGETGHYFWPVRPFDRTVKATPQDVLAMQKVFGDPSMSFVFHNSKFDLRMLETLGIEVKGRVEDTFIAGFVLRSNERSLGLKPLAKKYLDFPDDDESDLQKEVVHMRRLGKKRGWMIARKDVEGKEPVKADYWMARKEILLKYALGDVERTMLLWKIFREELETDEACNRIYNREMRLQKITMAMESRGVRIKTGQIKSEIRKHEARAADRLASLRNKISKDFNPNSNKQLYNLLYIKLGFPVKRYTDSGQPSVDSEALEEMDHPLVQTLREYRQAMHANKSFFERFLQTSMRESDGYDIIHPDFQQIGPKTGRYACREPNLQNVANALSTRSSLPIQARGVFSPRLGCVWLCWDYAGQEMWIFGDKSQEQKLLAALYSGIKPHVETAKVLYGADVVEAEEKAGLKNAKAKAKMFNFGIIYGMGVPAAMDFLKCGESEAREKLDRYHKAYPRIKPFMDEMTRLCRDQGYIESAYGRKIWMDRDWGYRAVNYYVQGTAADIMKESLLKLQDYIQKKKLPAWIVMTIHDEIVIEIEKASVSSGVIHDVQKIMEEHPCLQTIRRIPVTCAMVASQWDKKIELSKEDILNVRKIEALQ